MVSTYALQGFPAVYFSVLASSVIIVAARACLLPPCVVPAFGLRLHFPELLAGCSLFQAAPAGAASIHGSAASMQSENVSFLGINDNPQKR